MKPKATHLFLLTILATCLFGIREVRASHFMGVDATWECVNNCTVRVYLRAYRDCSGVTTISNNISFLSTGGPGCTAPTPVTAWSAQVTTEVTPICPTVPTQCTQPGAIINGVQEYFWWRDYDVCSSLGCEFEIQWSGCCRNGAITSGAANAGFGINPTFTVGASGCVESPTFTNYPLFYACAGQSYVIHQGGYAPNADSVVYSLIPCMSDANGTPITFSPGYSAAQPLGPSWNVSIDPSSGMVTLTPQPGNLVVGVLCIAVESYDNGVLTSRVIRDMQITVLNCPANNQPAFTPITNLTGGATLAGNDIYVCPSTSFCFDIGATDADTALQSVSIFWDANIPTATFTEVGNPSVTDTVTGNSPDAQFCWTAPATPGVYPFLISIEDNACPIFGQQDMLVNIVVGGTSSPNLIQNTGTLQTCAGTGDTLSVTGSWTNYDWSTGATTSSIVVTTPGVYGVTVSNGGCPTIDTILVTDAPADITGTVLDNGGNPLVYQKVYLIRHDTSNHSLHAHDSTLTDSSGYYEFCSVSLDTAYVKAAPDSASYPTDMPTYADTALVWNNAVPWTSFPTVVNFSTRFGQNPGGPGFIGGLVTQGANKVNGPGDPVIGLRVFLYSNTLDQPVAFTDTDVNGYFSFPDVPLGDYSVIADKPLVDEVNVPTLTLTAQTPSMDSLDFRLHSTYLELYLGTSIPAPQPEGFSVEVAPNPMPGSGRILLNMDEAAEVSITLTDIAGRQVAHIYAGEFAAGKHRLDVDSELLPAADGIYFLRVQAGERIVIKKVVVQ